MSFMRDQFDEIKRECALRYSVVQTNDVYGIVYKKGFKLGLGVVIVVRKEKKHIQVKDIHHNHYIILLKKNYGKEWFLRKQM